MARLQVNYICLIGVAIGLVALIGYWWMLGPSFTERMDPETQKLWIQKLAGVMAPPILFLIGTLIAIVTPLGGIVQLTSIFNFIFETPPIGYLFTSGTSVNSYTIFSFTIFLATAMLSSIIVLYSMRSPSWISRDDGTFPRSRDRISIFQRLLTFRIIKESALEEA